MEEWTGYSSLAAICRPPVYFGWSFFEVHEPYAAAITYGVAMEKTAEINVSEFEEQAQKFLSLALDLCENRIKAHQGNITPELKALSAAAMFMDKAIAVFISTERLCK
jgi:hypothetical protein